MVEAKHGVTIVICCHNSAGRLPPTLTHLAAQRVPTGIPWEVLVVDNASTDGTAQTAIDHWPHDAPAPLRVVREPQLGLSHARRRGLLDARYEIVSFVDDDNWVCPEWVQTLVEVMGERADVGACGGFSEAECEVSPPAWFARHAANYAVGPQGPEPGDITGSRGFLWGVGFTLRQSAWRQLVDNGFRPLSVDRRGKALTSGGDSELSYALRLGGWRLWYEPRLYARHFLPAERLTWAYLRRLFRGFGMAHIELEPYRLALNPSPASRQQRWQWRLLAELNRLAGLCAKQALTLHYPGEGDDRALQFELAVGRIVKLLRVREAYDASIREVRDARWRRIHLTRAIRFEDTA